jgi:hypothetical protein
MLRKTRDSGNKGLKVLEMNFAVGTECMHTQIISRIWL